MPADYFYEWKALSVAKNAKKQPYAIQLKSGDPFALAGLWDAWREPRPKAKSIHTLDTWLQTFSMITTEANELMSEIHSRMPVILYERDWARWIDRGETDQPPIDLLKPYESDAMQMHPGNPTMVNVKNNGPEMLECPVPIPGMSLNSA